MPSPTRPTRLLLARPRGYCAGVERAVEAVEQMLAIHGPPIYVRKQIVHNLHVVRRLEQQGAIFVESEDDVPEGATRRALGARRRARGARATRRCAGCASIDATCPLVTKVHKEARRFAGDGYTIFLIGHAGHEEVVGTMGEAPDEIVLVQSVEDVARLPEPRSREARLHHPDDALRRRDHRRSSRRCSSASRRSSGRPRTTSATRRRTARPRSSRSRARSTWCS